LLAGWELGIKREIRLKPQINDEIPACQTIRQQKNGLGKRGGNRRKRVNRCARMQTRDAGGSIGTNKYWGVGVEIGTKRTKKKANPEG